MIEPFSVGSANHVGSQIGRSTYTTLEDAKQQIAKMKLLGEQSGTTYFIKDSTGNIVFEETV